MKSVLTAEEARELTAGSMKCKGYLYKIRLAWICGLVNKKIENAAENGENYVILEFSYNVSKKYFPIMSEIYGKLGYTIGYNNWKFMISWNFQELSSNEKNHFVYSSNYFKKAVSNRIE